MVNWPSRRLLAALLAVSITSNLALLARSRESPGTAAVPALRPGDHVLGSAAAPVTVIEYADYFCPACKQMHATMRVAAGTGRVRWVLRHRPIPELHPRAVAAAEAAECAAEQNAFWRYSHALYEMQPETPSGLQQLAVRIGLDAARFAACTRSARPRARVEDDMADAARLRIDATPTYFVDHRRYEGWASAMAFQQQLLQQ